MGSNDREMMMFARNAWYVAATPDEVVDKPLGRQICNERMVFYRGADGGVVALGTSARTGARPCRWGVSARVNWSAATTG
jgi:hypothetical protein